MKGLLNTFRTEIETVKDEIFDEMKVNKESMNAYLRKHIDYVNLVLFEIFVSVPLAADILSINACRSSANVNSSLIDRCLSVSMSHLHPAIFVPI